MNDFEVIEILKEMAGLTGNLNHVEHWEKLIKQDPDHIRLMFDQRWEANGHENFLWGQRMASYTPMPFGQCVLNTSRGNMPSV